MKNQLKLFEAEEESKTKIFTIKKGPRLKIDSKSAQLFWDKVYQAQSKSPMTRAQANYIAVNLLNWDLNELEVQLILAGATADEKEFYLKQIYPYARKYRIEYEKQLCINESQGE